MRIGKAALLKNRLMGAYIDLSGAQRECAPTEASVPGGLRCPCRLYVRPGVDGCLGATRLLSRRILQRGDIRQVAVALGEVQTVADGEAIGDLEADEADRELHLAAVGLGQQRADLQRGQVAPAGGVPEGFEGQARG